VKNKAIIIFVRNPVAGKVKTRLAKTMGNEKALRVYRLLLEHTRKITEQLDCDKFLYYSDHVGENDGWDNAIFRKKLQRGEGLGARMSNAFGELFSEGYERLVIIGSDCLELTGNLIHDAFDRLNEVNVVIGPSSDGGYYLLGARQPFPASLFENKTWSTDSVLADTLKDLETSETTYRLLTMLNDIDEEGDVPAALLKAVDLEENL
jgi:uncharacterized protein